MTKLSFVLRFAVHKLTVLSASSASFADIENSMHKRRRLNQPALPTTVDAVDGPFFVIAFYLSFLANVNSSACSLYVVVRPSVVCLSSVCNVRAPYSDD